MSADVNLDTNMNNMKHTLIAVLVFCILLIAYYSIGGWFESL